MPEDLIGLNRLPQHRSLLGRAVNHFRDDGRILGLVLGGSDSGSLVAVVSRSARSGPARVTPEVLAELDQRFWTWCWYVFGKIVRGELWEALDGAHTIRSHALLPLLALAAERHHEGYRCLERKLDPATSGSLSATVASLQPEALYAALQAEIFPFRELRAIVFGRYSLTFDPGPGDIIEAEISRRWATEEA